MQFSSSYLLSSTLNSSPPSHTSAGYHTYLRIYTPLVSLSQTVTMTDRSLVKKPRPVVFTLAELEGYPTLEDRYAITLPFRASSGHYCSNWYMVDCTDCEVRYSEVKAKCIKRTGERWAVSTPSEPRLFALQQPGPSKVSWLKLAGPTKRC